MASGLRAKLRAIHSEERPKPAPPRPSGLLMYTERRDLEDGLFNLDGVGLRRMGWSGRSFDVRRCLFLDTETTGLSGGAGTVAFLVGVGFVEGDHFTIEQYLMRDYSDEASLIDRLASRMDEFDCVCTFNGQTFDMPLLEARFTMMRMRHRWREMENLDLITPARRAWKLRLRSCKLSRIEEIIFNRPREGDLPGSEVPQRYFDFLKSGNLALLEDIIEHNRQDIATLATLLVRLNGIFASPLETLSEKRDLYSLGKTLERQGEIRPAKEVYTVSAIPPAAGTLAALTDEPVSAASNWRLYVIARRSGDVEEMRTVLERMLARRQMPCEVNIELSKLYEHKLKNPKSALRYALAAREFIHADDMEALENRINRLKTKLEKSQK